jgi:ATP-binding cassette, subfamily C, bacterial LapB
MNFKKIFHPSLNFAATFLLQHFNSDVSLTSFCSKMPLNEGLLSPALLQKGLENQNFKTDFVKRNLKDIDVNVFPVVAFKENSEAIIIKDINLAKGLVTIHSLEVQTGAIIKIEDLEPTISDTFLFIRKMRTNNEENKLTWFWGTLQRFKPLWLQVAIAAFLINCFALSAPLFTMNVYDRVIPNKAEETLWVLFSGILIIYIFDFILKNLRSYFIDVAGRGSDVIISAKLFEQFQNIKLANKNNSAGALAHQMKEFEGLRDFLTSASISALVDLPFILLFIIVLALIGGPIALVVLAILPISLFVAYLLQKKIEHTNSQTWQDLSQKNSHLIETLQGIETVKSLNIESSRQAVWEAYIGTTSLLGMKSRYYMNMANSFSGFMQQMTTVLIIAFGSYSVMDGKLSMGALIACSMIAGRVISPVSTMVALSMRYSYAKHAYTELNGLMDVEVDIPENKKFLKRNNVIVDIACKNLEFTYPTAEQPSIRDVNFNMKPGEKIAIIGRSGSGKSTFVRLLNSLYALNKGQILIDGTDINQINPNELRQQVLLVPQTPHLFYGTLRENLRMVNPFASEEEILQACSLVDLIDVIKQHPQGLDMHLGESGSGLSGGQKQAVCIARALLKKPKTIILDEPTSNMDSMMEERFCNSLSKILSSSKVGLILITHKESLLRLVDRIVVMEKGTIVLDAPKQEALIKLSKPTTTTTENKTTKASSRNAKNGKELN